MIYCTLYNPALDLVYEVSNLEESNTFIDVPSILYPAGKGVNVAKVIATLEEEVSVVALMPRNDSARFRHSLDEVGAQFIPFEIDGDVRINTTLLERSSGIVQHFNSLSMPLSTQLEDQFGRFISERMVAGDTWIFSGSLPRGMDTMGYHNLIKFAQSKGIECYLDSRGGALREALKAKPVVVTPNLSELEEYFGQEINGISEIVKRSKSLIAWGIEYLFVTLGEDGLLAFHNDMILRCTAPDIIAVDTVGCGDAFLAGVTVAIKREFSFREICRFAVATGSNSAESIGPGIVTKSRIAELMESVVLEELSAY